MIVLETGGVVRVLSDMGYPASLFTDEFRKDLEFISMFLLGYGIKLGSDLGFLNLFTLKFNDSRQELLFRLKYGHLIKPKWQIL